MKTIDFKSALIGALAVLVILLSAGGTTATRQSEESGPVDVAVVGNATYHRNSGTLRVFGAGLGGKIKPEPLFVYKVADDGSTITEIK